MNTLKGIIRTILMPIMRWANSNVMAFRQTVIETTSEIQKVSSMMIVYPSDRAPESFIHQKLGYEIMDAIEPYNVLWETIERPELSRTQDVGSPIEHRATLTIVKLKSEVK